MLCRLANIEPASSNRRLIGLISLLSLLNVLLVACADATDPPIASSVRELEQINHAATGYDARGGALPIPSIDPAGIAYHAPLEGLLIADSEITEVKEVFENIAATWFLTSTRVDVTKRRWNVSEVDGAEQVRNLESTGIAYCEFDGHVYVTNDDLDLVLRYSYDGANFNVVDIVSTVPETDDPEGITCDPQTGMLYVVGGESANIVSYSYNDGFVLRQNLELHDTAGHRHGKLDDVEGIAFDPVSRHLFAVSTPAMRIVEYDLAGRFVNKFDLGKLSPAPIAPQGLSIGPASIDPNRMSVFLADGGLDNDDIPEERDGAIYELLIVRKDD